MATIKSFEDFLDRMQGLLDNAKKQGHIIVRVEDLENAFPELAESEDEKIRKSIIAILNNYVDNSNSFKPKMLAWLEKQGEQKSADKVEPKFKVGKWYQCTKDFFGKGVTFDKNTAYYCAKEGCLQDEYGCHIAIVKDLYDNFKLWAIQDAKDGDVLATWAGAFIYNGNNGGGSCPGSYCGINTLGNFKVGKEHHWTGKNVFPATKEQRDFLFHKMEEEGYEWDAEKKELKKIEQKPAWSEEDEEEFQIAIDTLVKAGQHDSADWLKSLRQRIGG